MKKLTTNHEKCKIKLASGITLITLVITIVLLIILAGVAINISLGENGLFTRAKRAKHITEEAIVSETITNIILEIQIDEIEKNGKLTLKQISDILETKDKNIKMEEYIDSSKNIKGTYNLNGKEYDFVINEKLEVEIKKHEDSEPKIVNTPSTSDVQRQANEIPFNWKQLAEISKAIQNTLKDDNNNNDITSNTSEFILNYEGKEYTIGVGDWKKIEYDGKQLKVRIMGFNHDILAGQNILNENGTLKDEYKELSNNNELSDTAYNKLNKAGISFEFVDCIMVANMYAIDSTEESNIGGWANRQLRKTLNGEEEANTRIPGTIDSLTPINQYIKKVIKPYAETYNSSVVSYVEDKMWLISCGEIWGTSALEGCISGWSKSMEGKQYKIYKNANALYDVPNEQVKKQNNNTDTWSRLRSPSYNTSSLFCGVFKTGICDLAYTSTATGIAPGFCI